jgi:endonuclease/exonuclease/phosphatase (EEP) superfamily protein YafD
MEPVIVIGAGDPPALCHHPSEVAGLRLADRSGTREYGVSPGQLLRNGLFRIAIDHDHMLNRAAIAAEALV